jgi:hypothetical protein
MEMRASLQASLPTLTRSKNAGRALARLPCSQGDVSIFEMWCTIIVMQVDVRLALNQLWDNGGQDGQEGEESESKEEEDRQEEVGLRQHCRDTSKADTHQGACALPPARLILPRLAVVQRPRTNPSRTGSRASADWSGFFVEGAQPLARGHAAAHGQRLETNTGLTLEPMRAFRTSPTAIRSRWSAPPVSGGR